MTENYTALYEEHKKLGASFTDFGGWQMPLKYSSELAEHHAVRKSAGLFDLSHMGEVWVTGPEAAAFLDYALVGKISAMADGKAKYSLICQEDGGIIDDLITYRRGADKFLVVPNAGNAKVVADALLERAAGFDVVVEDASARTSLIAVQGPLAEAILLRLVPADQHALVTGLKYYAAVEVTFLVAGSGQDLLLARTGYTGEDGFEIFVPNESAAALWQAIAAVAEEGELVPAGLASRDSLRLEAGMPLYGNELSREGNPFAAGLGAVVALSKEGDFVGKDALAALKADGAGSTTGRKLVGLKGLGRRAGRGHYPVLKDGAVVGEVTSGQPSPTLGYPVALAYVDVEHTELGTALDIDLRGKSEPFEVVALPFYKRQK
ncbi:MULTISPECIES: glycine cleavage system aminomethyltransferase GcvT [Paenarthrobacter]|jgi:aminomethyltransferase|uniref:Aminomethyltransferase n=1 Tax=Paenarthrobacter nicotinovorans TaxID=29320 RepID=A0ABT9TV96_PAENI|nr:MULTISPECIES: glycine cleavage system aminomethyltransferase GcvT [Paenarthrobacter]KQR00952.1 glycine cleavage system protein T [Arthrobacter sp. Leaf145]BCW09625.1 aminomethyltransferase [Arthrobacter sp. NtRootA2]BCW13705.1 aminomethyltransferase [Arthrobacter sp. NtRootA4]BCW22041.1 aminomethyltransferase [Arthrobacter sp. NtRootC7]BCW26309.1 aminomethyltransferase [Arthrobacter sp. NtRootC45]BCW30578.1 aminomethyltransferase [Arthrobacter sp. NtRootD5]